MKNIKKGSFVVVSDFHSYDWPLEKVKEYYLDEYETIYILGDVTDRGELSNGSGGISILRKIKKLCDMYPGRVVYVPGNHDEFLYQYAKYRDYSAQRNLEFNHGHQTMVDIDNLKSQNPREFNELMDWLGNLPLQREHYFEGKRFVLAHALFDEKLFKENKYFSLEDYRKNGGNYGDYKNIIWFRKDDDDYSPERLPRKDSIMIVGHTPLCYREGDNLNLENMYGETVRVECVDGGIAYDGRMLKYSAGRAGCGINNTFKHNHVDRATVAPKEKKVQTENKEQIENKVNRIILLYIREASTLEEAINKLIGIVYSKGDGQFNINGNSNDSISKKQVKEYLDEVYISYIPTNGKVNQSEIDYMEIFKLHFTKVALDYISKCQYKRFQSRSTVAKQYEDLFKYKDYFYITNSVGRARDIAEKVGLNNMAKWFRNSNYQSFEEYVNKEFGKQFIKD